MTISEYIKELETIKEAHGDLQVDADFGFGRVIAGVPKVAYRKLLSKRESREEFYPEWNDHADSTRKGEKVVRL